MAWLVELRSSLDSGGAVASTLAEAMSSQRLKVCILNEEIALMKLESLKNSGLCVKNV